MIDDVFYQNVGKRTFKDCKERNTPLTLLSVEAKTEWYKGYDMARIPANGHKVGWSYYEGECGQYGDYAKSEVENIVKKMNCMDNGYPLVYFVIPPS
jgi:hypothetical protein